jgi:hypothetical protein
MAQIHKRPDSAPARTLTAAEMLDMDLEGILLHWRAAKESEMADDKTKTGKPDRDRINVDEEYELREWAEKFGVTPDRLKQAVKTSGPMVKDIEALLGKHIR